MNKSFFAGIEEVFSRLIATVITVIFFLIYIFAKESKELVLNWSGLLMALVVFWLVYEFLAYCLYAIFIYFSKQSQQQVKATDIKSMPKDDTVMPETDNNIEM